MAYCSSYISAIEFGLHGATHSDDCDGNGPCHGVLVSGVSIHCEPTLAGSHWVLGLLSFLKLVRQIQTTFEVVSAGLRSDDILVDVAERSM